jgi:hypothetical protein
MEQAVVHNDPCLLELAAHCLKWELRYPVVPEASEAADKLEAAAEPENWNPPGIYLLSFGPDWHALDCCARKHGDPRIVIPTGALIGLRPT